MATEQSDWRRWACSTIVFASDPGDVIDRLPQLNDHGECTLADTENA